MTMGPGGGSDPGNAGRGGGSSAGRGASGGGGFGRDTPGSPNAADGRRGSSMGPDGGTAPGRGATGGGGLNDTPGAPGNPGRRGQNAAGSTAASRARDAMSRHQRERNIRSIENGGNSLVDNDGQYGAGLSLDESIDRQQTENSLNRADVTDTLGMSRSERIDAAIKAGAHMSQQERQAARGITAGHTNQFAANRAKDILGAVPGFGLLADEMAKRSRPANTMQSHYNEGRELANDTEIGILGESALGYGLQKSGVSAPMGPINFAQAIARDPVQNSEVATMRSAGFGSGYASTASQTPGGGNGKARTAIAAMSKSPGITESRPPGNAFGWSPVNIDRYSRNPMNMARNS